MLSSCAPEFYCKRCPTTTLHTIEIRDTIIIRETLKDTTITIYLPADSVITVHRVVCDSAGLAQMQQVEIRLRNMVAKMQIENGELTHNLVQIMDSLDVTITYKEREITNLKSKVEKLEQLRLLENGGRILMAQACQLIPPGVDTPGDLERVRKALRKRSE